MRQPSGGPWKHGGECLDVADHNNVYDDQLNQPVENIPDSHRIKNLVSYSNK